MGSFSRVVYSDCASNLLMYLGAESAVASENPLKSLRIRADFDSTMRRFESSRPSQAVWRPEEMVLTLAERPANGGLLRISYQPPRSNFRHSRNEFADGLRQTFEKLPFLGDCGRRQGSICTAWRQGQCN